jgi:LPXTG-motif cell wall-anchored protein
VAVPKQGTIIVKKVADEYDTDKEFPFSSNFDGLPNDGADFTLEAGATQEFVLDAGIYSVNELVPAGWNLVSAVCSDQSPVNAIVLAAEETVTCIFTNEKNSYDQYPGDPDFDFDTPFDDAGDPGTPAPTGDTAGTVQTGTQQPAAPAPVVENNVTTSQPNPAEPVVLDQLPRTGQGLDRITMLGGMMLILGGLTVIFSRRRKAHKA